MFQSKSVIVFWFYWHAMSEAFQSSGHACTVCDSTPWVFTVVLRLLCWISSCAEASMKQLVPSAQCRGSRRSDLCQYNSMSPQHADGHWFSFHSKPIGTSLQCGNQVRIVSFCASAKDLTMSSLSKTIQHLNIQDISECYFNFQSEQAHSKILHPSHHRRVRSWGRLERTFFDFLSITTFHSSSIHLHSYIYKQIWNKVYNHVALSDSIIVQPFQRYISGATF